MPDPDAEVIIRDLLGVATNPDKKGCPPSLVRKAYEYLGDHRVLVETRYGPAWLSPSDARTYDNPTQRDKILDEINGNEFCT